MRTAILVRPATLALVAVLDAACGGSPEAAPALAATVGQSAAPDARHQYGLARAVDEARRAGADTATAELERVRQSWLHARVHWELGFSPAFCRDRGPCMALPFDHQRLRTTMPQGWLPELDLDDDARRELARCCAAVDGQCVFDLHGTLARFDLSRERPTSLALHDVEIGTCRAARTGESWVRRADPHVAMSRTEGGRG